MNLEEATINVLKEDVYSDYVENEKALAADYQKRVTDKVTPDVIRNFGKLKEILEDGSNKIEQEGFYFPEEAINILKYTDRRHNLNGFMDLTIADILNMVSNFDTPEEAIEDLFNEYKPDSALAWGDNFVTVLSQLVFNLPEEDLEESKSNKEDYVGKKAVVTNDVMDEYEENVILHKGDIVTINSVDVEVDGWGTDYVKVTTKDNEVIEGLSTYELELLESKEIKTEVVEEHNLSKEPTEIQMIITVESGLNADGFDITIKEGDKEVFNKSYRYGYDASYSKEHADSARHNHKQAIKYNWEYADIYYNLKPYTQDIIEDLMKKYHITKNNIIVTNGKNVFKGEPVSDNDVNEFINKYIEPIKESKSIKEDVEEHDLSKDLYGDEAERRLSQEQKDLQRDLQYVRDIMAGKEVIDDKYHEKLSLDTAKKWLRKDFVNVNCLASADPDDIDKKLAKEYPDIFGKEIKTEGVNWSYYNKPDFSDVNKKYLPDTGEGETFASQIVTAINKLVYKWYNDGDVYDNVNSGLEGGANDLSSFANWLYKYAPGEVPNILKNIYGMTNKENYEDLLKELADYCLNSNLLSSLEKDTRGSIYNCDGPFEFTDNWYDDEDEYYDDWDEEEW